MDHLVDELNKYNFNAVIHKSPKMPVAKTIAPMAIEIPKKELPDFFLPKEQDKLFWIFFVIKYGFSPYFSSTTSGYETEKMEKFKFIENLREKKDILKEYKFKKIQETIESDLATSVIITINTFFALCAVEKVNMLFIYNSKKYYEICGGAESNLYHVIYYTSKHNSKYKTTTDDIAPLKVNLFKCETMDMSKGLKSVSFYKLNDLIEISKSIGLDISKMKKKDEIYTGINAYLL